MCFIQWATRRKQGGVNAAPNAAADGRSAWKMDFIFPHGAAGGRGGQRFSNPSARPEWQPHRRGPDRLREPPGPGPVHFSNPRGPADISRIGVGCDGTAKLHGQGKLISAIHRHTRHAMEAHGRPVCVEGGKEMRPPSRSVPAPEPWKAHGCRRWISIPSTRRALLSLSPTENVNYTKAAT